MGTDRSSGGLAIIGALTVLVSSFSLPTSRAASATDGNLLRNGDFEMGDKSVADWNTIYPPILAKKSPWFISSTDRPHGGVHAGTIEVEYEGGYTSFTQPVRLDSSAKMIHFEAFARMDANATKTGAASIMIWFTVPGAKDGGELMQSRQLESETEWTLLTVDAAIPKGATEAVARVGVVGPCKASFDDALLTTSDREGATCKLGVAAADYSVKAKATTAKAFVSLSIPFPLGGQTPLAIRVTSDPPNKVAALEIEKDHENRPLKIHLAALTPGETVAITVETLTLLRDRPLADGAGVALPAKAKITKDVALHLKAAPGIDCDDAGVKKLAATFSKKDFGALMTDVAKALHEKLKYDAGLTQGAKDCLASGKAVCTGYANVGASLLIASGVPARILACVTLGSRLQEHYIVEAWTSELGWSRMESTSAIFPWRDSENLVLRIVYPEAPRSVADVPLYKESSSDVVADFKMGNDSCWQGGALLGTSAIEMAALTAIESLARAKFEDLTKGKCGGAQIAFVPAVSDPANKLPASAGEIQKAVNEWLKGK